MIPIRNIKRNKLRSFLLVLAVTLTVSLQIGIAISVDSLLSDFVHSQRNLNYTDITIRSKDDLTFENISDLIPLIQSVDGVGKVSIAATVPLENIVSLNDTQSGRYPLLYGCDKTHPDFSTLELKSGKRSLKPGEVIISETIAYFLEIDEGDVLVLDSVPAIGFTGASLVVSAIMYDDYPFANSENYAFVLVDYNHLKGLFDDNSQFSYYIAVSIPYLIDINEKAEKISDLELESGVNLGDSYFILKEKYIDQLKATGFLSYQTAMNLLIMASYLIEFLFITNVFAITMKERSREFGTLRAIGTSKRQIISLVFSETGLIGLIGSTIGIIFGLVLSFFLLYIFKYYLGYSGISDLIIQLPTMIVSYLTGLFTTVLAGIWPLIVVLRLPIVQNMHSLKEAKLKKRRIFTWQTGIVFGLLLIIAGVITSSAIEGAEFLGFELISAHSLVILLIFAGTLIFEIAIVSRIPNLSMKLLNRPKLVPILIATKDVEREIQRSTITIFTAALSLTFILMVGIVSGGLFDAVPEYYRQSFGESTDLIIESWDHYEFNTSFTETLIEENYWINKTAYMQEERGSLNIGSNVYFFGINATSYDHFLTEFMLEPLNGKISTIFDQNTFNVVITDILAENLGVSINEPLEIQFGSGSSVDIQVGGVCTGNSFIHGGEYIFIDTTLFESIWNKTSSKWFVADLDLNSLPQQQAEAALSDTYPLLKSVKSTYYYYRMIEGSLAVQGAFIHLIFVHSFLLAGLTQFISILISTLKMERDVAVMRSIGLSKGEVFRLFVSEAGLLGFTGVIIGIVNSIIGSDLLAWYISWSIPIEAKISGLQDQFLFILWIFISLIVTFGSSYIPSKRASQTNIIAAISGRTDRKNIRAVYRARQLDVKSLAEKFEKDSEKKVIELKPELEDGRIEEQLNEILSLSKGLDLLVEENKKWSQLFNKQLTDYEDGKLDPEIFEVRIKRYKTFLLREKKNSS
jgi:putative ABC transport system permease protein